LILSTPAGGGTAPGPAPVKTSRHASKSRCTAVAGAAIGWGAPAPRRGRRCRCRRRPCAPASLGAHLLSSSSGTPPLDSTRIKALAGRRECEGQGLGLGESSRRRQPKVPAFLH